MSMKLALQGEKKFSLAEKLREKGENQKVREKEEEKEFF